MIRVERGKVEGGRIVLDEPLEFPDGTEVTVSIKALTDEGEATNTTADQDITTLPFFGMWADREDMADSVAWVRRVREQWHQRADRRA